MKGPRGECDRDGEVPEGRGGDRSVTAGFGGGRHGEGARVVAEEVFCGHSPTGRKYSAATAICHSHSSMQLHVFILSFLTNGMVVFIIGLYVTLKNKVRERCNPVQGLKGSAKN